MSRVHLASRRHQRVPSISHASLRIALLCAVVLLFNACASTVPPVEQPPPRGLPDGVPLAATRPEPALPTPLRSAGIDHVLIVSSRGAWIIDVLTGARTPLGQAAVTVDRDPGRAMGSFVARVPTTALPGLTGTWRVRAAAGLATPDGMGFAPVPTTNGSLPGQPAVYNVTFRAAAQEPPANNFWMDRTQAMTLLTGDVSAFSATVDWAALSAQQETPEPVLTGYSNRWYASSLEVGKGVVADTGGNPAGDLRPNFLGRVQPYAVYVPTTSDTASPTPLTWMLHSLGVNHLGWAASDLFASPAANMGDLSRQRNPGQISYSWFPDLTRADPRQGFPRADRPVAGLPARRRAMTTLGGVMTCLPPSTCAATIVEA